MAKWILANGSAMALGFWTYLNLLMAIAFGLDFERWWSEAAVDGIENAERLLRLGSAIGLPLAGAVFTSLQAPLLRRTSVDLRWWILAGPLGFVGPLLVIWALTSIWGDIPGPVEPFTIVGGGLIGVGSLQWWSLRRRGVSSGRWLALWCLGLPLGMAAFMLVYTVVDSVLPGSIGWAAEVGLIGFAIGSVAAAASGRSLLSAIAPSAPVVETGSTPDED
ncbi:MAG: hypothetical protein R2909_00315 [Gemmatimonadales bacterium]